MILAAIRRLHFPQDKAAVPDGKPALHLNGPTVELRRWNGEWLGAKASPAEPARREGSAPQRDSAGGGGEDESRVGRILLT